MDILENGTIHRATLFGGNDLHTLILLVFKLLLIAVTAVLFTFTVAIRPGGQCPSKKNLVKLLLTGAVIGILFISTQSMYEVSSTF